MKYKLLKRFCGIPNRPFFGDLPRYHNLFESGIPYYQALGTKEFDMFCITYGTTSMVMFTVVVKNNIDKWKEKMDKHTSSAEWDIIKKEKQC
jgi:hypothetical protein